MIDRQSLNVKCIDDGNGYYRVSLTIGKIYAAKLGRDDKGEKGLLSIFDDTNDWYVFPSCLFEVVEEENVKMECKNYRLQLIEELAESGNHKAMMDICQRYFDTKKYHNSDKITKYLKILSDNNNKRAMLLLGIMYYTGLGVDQNYKEAAKWYEKAADEMEPYGLCSLGYCYSYGRDMPVNYERAYECFSLSAYLGNANAMYKLGDMFFYGNHVDEDKCVAFYWYEESLKYGRRDEEVEPNIKYRLGKCYLHGYGTEQNSLFALEYLQEAELGFFKQIEDGNSFAKLTLPKVRKELDIVRSMLYDDYGL